MLEKLRDLIEFRKLDNKVLLTVYVLYGDSVGLSKEQLIELAGEIYELAESMEEVPVNILPFEKGECLGEQALEEQKSMSYKEIYTKYARNNSK